MSQRRYWTAPTWPRRSLGSRAVAGTYTAFCELIAERINLDPGSKVLDVGTGHGPLMYYLLKQYPNVTGLDLSEHMLSLNLCRGKLVRGNAVCLPFGNETFDLVVGSGVLHHLSREEQAITVREMLRVSRGAIVALEPNRLNPAMFLFGLLKKEERNLLTLSKHRLCGLFASAGAEVDSWTVNGLILPNSMPEWMLPVASALNRSWLARMTGFFVMCAGHKPSSATCAPSGDMG